VAGWKVNGDVGSWLYDAVDDKADGACNWKWELNRIIKDSGLYTIVIPSTSPHPTPLERRYEGMMNSSWIHILFQQYFSYGKEILV
jgi:hypothetical protein